MESFLTAFAMDLGMCRIGIKGMTCGACVATIENYIPNAVDGVISISVGLLAERAEVIYDKCTTEPKQIAAAIEDVGFQAQILLEVRRCLPFLCGGGTLLITEHCTANNQPSQIASRGHDLRIVCWKGGECRISTAWYTECVSKPSN